jgi:hypothetical protein
MLLALNNKLVIDERGKKFQPLPQEQELAKRQRLLALGVTGNGSDPLPPTLKPQVPIPNSSSLLTVSQPEAGNQKTGSSSNLICRFPNPNYQQPPPPQQQQQQQQAPVQQQQPPVLLPYAGQPQFETSAPSPSPSPPPQPVMPDDPKEWSIGQVSVVKFVFFFTNLMTK